MHNTTQPVPQQLIGNHWCLYLDPGHIRERVDAGYMGHLDSKTGLMNSFAHFEFDHIVKMALSQTEMLSPLPAQLLQPQILRKFLILFVVSFPVHFPCY